MADHPIRKQRRRAPLLDSNLPRRVLLEHHVGYRLCLAGVAGFGEMFWLAMEWGAYKWSRFSGLRLIDFVSLNLRLKDLLGPVTRVKKKKKSSGSRAAYGR